MITGFGFQDKSRFELLKKALDINRSNNYRVFNFWSSLGFEKLPEDWEASMLPATATMPHSKRRNPLLKTETRLKEFKTIATTFL